MPPARGASVSGLVVHGILAALTLCTVLQVHVAADVPMPPPNATTAAAVVPTLSATSGVAPVTSTAPSTGSATPTDAASVPPTAALGGIDAYRFSSCAGYRDCVDAFATCVEAAGPGSATLAAVLSNAPFSLSCDSVTRCLAAHFSCLDRLATAARSNAQHSCYAWAGTSYVEMLRTSVDSYVGSPLQASCHNAVIEATNASGRPGLAPASGCTMRSQPDSADLSAVCSFREPTRRVLARGEVWFEGRAWATLAASVADEVRAASAADIAAQLGVAPEFLEATAPVVEAATNASATISFQALEGTAGVTVNTVLAAAQATASNSADASAWMPRVADATASTRRDEPLRVARFVASDGVSAAPQGYDYLLQVTGNWAQWRYVSRNGLFADEGSVPAALIGDLAAHLAVDATKLHVVGVPLTCGLLVRIAVSRGAGLEHSAILDALRAGRGAANSHWLTRTTAAHDAVFANSPLRVGPLESVGLAAVQAAIALSNTPADVASTATCATAETLGLLGTPPSPPTSTSAPRWRGDPGFAVPTPAPSPAPSRGLPARRVLLAAAAAAAAVSFAGFTGG